MDSYMASIMTFAFNWTPMYFAQCNGATLQIQQNSALYALIGVVFGGNGSTNFMLPNLQGRTPVHYGTAAGGTARAFGIPFGQDNMTLTQTQLPTHGHTLQEVQAGQTVTTTTAVTVNAGDAQGTVNKPQNTAYWAKGWDAADSSVLSNYTNTKNVTMASDAVQVTVTPTFRATNLAIGAAGAGAAFPLPQPSLALNFCICTAGIFPSRT
ncbi:MAG: hypothetical protein A2076_03380 [Geobacteraceae bacterium GWC2_53_11]|nr:MAG: hypothetical protein A2076_03380 [Geobacteraceae bacterium GWC2_53_11]